MTLPEITRLVALGEGLHIEFKRKVPQPKRLAKEIIAFANTEGGRLLLGVDDDGTILGVRDAEEEEYSFREALQQHCDPPVQVISERVPISRKRDLIMVRVPPSEARPHYLIDRENGTVNGTGKERVAYVRVKDMSIEASREAIRLMRSRKNQKDVRFEFGEKELKLMRYLDTYGQITVEQFANLANMHPRKASQTLVLLTRARVLAFHTSHHQDYFTRTYKGD